MMTMQTMLEIFYIRIVGKSVRYQRKAIHLNRKRADPDAIIWSLIREKHRTDAGETEEHEFIVHSTSWRYERGKIMLTYAAYSDELDLQKGKFNSLSLKNLRTIQRKSRKPDSQAELQNKVVSHALRHIAFLIQVGDQEDFKSVLTARTVKVFKTIWGDLAGEVLANGKRNR